MAKMPIELSEEHTRLSPCDFDTCEKDIYIVCPECSKFFCYDHIDNHGCKGHQLQVVAENLPELDLFKVIMCLRIAIQMLPKNIDKLHKVITALLSSPESIYRLFSDPEWYNYIASSKLWKNYCHFPELFWKREDLNNDGLINNWSLGIFKAKQINLDVRRIKLVKVYKDLIGQHWLFGMVEDSNSNIIMYVWEIKSEPPRLHCIKEIISLGGENISRTNIILSYGKLFIIWENFIQAFTFSYPDYNLEHMYHMACDLDKIIPEDCYQRIFEWLTRIRSRFCVHVSAKAIIGHAMDITGTGTIDIHIWDPSTGEKIKKVKICLSASEILSVLVGSQLCLIEQYLILDASITLKDGTTKSVIRVINVPNTFYKLELPTNNEQSLTTISHDPISFLTSSLEKITLTYHSDYNWDSRNIEVPKNVVFCKLISEKEIIIGIQLKKELEFEIYEINKNCENPIVTFTICRNKKNQIKPSFKIHFFKGTKEGNEMLCVAVRGRRLEVIDLRKTITCRSVQKKELFTVNDLKKLCFINPKFVILFEKEGLEDKADVATPDKKVIAELWDVENGHISDLITIPKEWSDNMKVIWHCTPSIPPSKLIISYKRNYFILDFEDTTD